MLDILLEFRKLQAEYSELENIEIEFVDYPGNLTSDIMSPITGKTYTCIECAGLFSVHNGNCKVEICKSVSNLWQLLILLHECRHAIQYSKSAHSEDEGIGENDADKFMIEQFQLKYNGIFSAEEVAETVKKHHIYQIGNAAKRNFMYDTTIIGNFLNSSSRT